VSDKTGPAEEGLSNYASGSRMAGVECGTEKAYSPTPRVGGASTSPDPPLGRWEATMEDAPMPPVKRGCRYCQPTDEQIASGYVIVSPSGVAHHSDPQGYGETWCGHNADGDRWWWPL